MKNRHSSDEDLMDIFRSECNTAIVLFLMHYPSTAYEIQKIFDTSITKNKIKSLSYSNKVSERLRLLEKREILTSTIRMKKKTYRINTSGFYKKIIELEGGSLSDRMKASRTNHLKQLILILERFSIQDKKKEFAKDISKLPKLDFFLILTYLIFILDTLMNCCDFCYAEKNLPKRKSIIETQKIYLYEKKLQELFHSKYDSKKFSSEKFINKHPDWIVAPGAPRDFRDYLNELILLSIINERIPKDSPLNKDF
jgi:DNA-binding PadR family transcriptional regulator